MSKKNNNCVRYEIEDAFDKILTGDALKNAKDFIAYLKTDNAFEQQDMCGGQGYSGLFLLHVYDDDPDPNPWYIYWHAIENIENHLDDELREFLLAHIRICTGHCGCKNWPRGGDQTVLGKEFKSLCSSRIMFHNPNDDEVKLLKKLIVFAKSVTGWQCPK